MQTAVDPYSISDYYYGYDEPKLFDIASRLRDKEFINLLECYMNQGANIVKSFPQRSGLQQSLLDKCLLKCARELIRKEKCDQFEAIYCSNIEYLLQRCTEYTEQENIDTTAVLFAFLQNCIEHRAIIQDEKFDRSTTGFVKLLSVMQMYPKLSDWSYRGIRGMTPLHLLTAMTALKGTDLDQCLDMALDNGADIHSVDIFGQTPLHFACAWKHIPMIIALLKRGADKECLDSFGWSPMCIGIKGTRYLRAQGVKHTKRDTQSFDINVLAALILVDTAEGMSPAELDIKLKDPVVEHCEQRCKVCISHKTAHKLLLKHLRGEYHCFDLFVLQKFDEFKEERKESTPFVHKLLTSEYVGPVSFTSSNAKLVYDQIMLLMRRVVEYISKADLYFECELAEAGSVAEGTKIRSPDEYDVNLVLKKLSNCKPCIPEEYKGDSRGKLCFPFDERNMFLMQYWKQFACKDYETHKLCLSADLIQNHVGQLVVKALSQKETWEGLNLYWRSMGMCEGLGIESPNLVWTGPEFPELPISLDIMPMFELQEWPPEFLNYDSGLLPIHEMNRGCLVMIKQGDFQLTPSKHELFVMNRIDPYLKMAYILCKILVDCIARTPKLQKLNSYFLENLIPTSYEMKNVVFQMCSMEQKSGKSVLSKDELTEVLDIQQLTDKDFDVIKEKAIQILVKTHLENYKEVGYGVTNYCLGSKCGNDPNHAVGHFQYQCPKFMCDPRLPMYIRVFEIKDLNLRNTLEKLLMD